MEEPKTIASEELLMEQLTNRDWNEFWLRLMGRCAWLLRKRYTVKWPNDKLKDFSRNAVGEIMEKIFVEKKRNWNLEKYPEFERFIVSALDSHVNNTLNNKSSESDLGENDHLLNSNEETDLSPADVLTVQELRKEVFDELQAAGADDDELMIFECLADGIEKPEDIKAELGINDVTFHNAWRRLKRKRDDIQKKLIAYGY
jgi:hypothetical protein